MENNEVKTNEVEITETEDLDLYPKETDGSEYAEPPANPKFVAGIVAALLTIVTLGLYGLIKKRKARKAAKHAAEPTAPQEKIKVNRKRKLGAIERLTGYTYELAENEEEPTEDEEQ